MKRTCLSFIAGILTGTTLFGGSVAAATELVVKPAWQPIYVNGQQVSMDAYNINGYNYVKLRDIGQAVGFNVYWLDGVQVDSDAPYTGEAPRQEVVNEATLNDEGACQEIVDLTNDLRREHGLPTFATNDKLMEAAQVRAEEMAASSVYSHVRPDGREYYTVTDCPYMAENIHQIADWQIKDGELAGFAVQEWSESPSHLKNMLNSRLSEIGVGLARGTNISGDPCWYCVQLFLYDGNTVHSVDTPTTIK